MEVGGIAVNTIVLKKEAATVLDADTLSDIATLTMAFSGLNLERMINDGTEYVKSLFPNIDVGKNMRKYIWNMANGARKLQPAIAHWVNMNIEALDGTSGEECTEIGIHNLWSENSPTTSDYIQRINQNAKGRFGGT